MLTFINSVGSAVKTVGEFVSQQAESRYTDENGPRVELPFDPSVKGPA